MWIEHDRKMFLLSIFILLCHDAEQQGTNRQIYLTQQCQLKC